MNISYSISIYLDTRRKKVSGKYPVKLRVFTPVPRIQKLYPTKFEFEVKEFKSIWETFKPRNEYKETRKQLQSIELNAQKIADSLEMFSFEQFEKKLFRKANDGNDVFYQFNITINKLKSMSQIGTANLYDASLKSIKNFLLYKKGDIPSKLSFYEVTSDWLEQYERYMLDTLNRSHNTVSMYLRSFRAIFNRAIDDKDIDKEIFPFGKKKYKIPSARGIKKALTKSELKTLFDAKPNTIEQEKAKDFWFFSYICNGINIKDIAYLKYKNIIDGQIVIYRAKTLKTKKSDLRPIKIYITDTANSIITKYGKTNPNPEQYIFSIIKEHQSIEEKYKRVKNFTRFINQNLKKLATKVGLTEKISTYYARHSFATNAINNGATMEFVSEAFTHGDMATTQEYFKGFEDKTKKELMDKMMDFE